MLEALAPILLSGEAYRYKAFIFFCCIFLIFAPQCLLHTNNLLESIDDLGKTLLLAVLMIVATTVVILCMEKNSSIAYNHPPVVSFFWFFSLSTTVTCRFKDKTREISAVYCARSTCHVLNTNYLVL